MYILSKQECSFFRDSIIHAYFCHSYVTLIKNYYLIMVQRKTRKTISTSNTKSANSDNTCDSNSSLSNMEEKKTILYYSYGMKMGGISTLEIGTPYFFDFLFYYILLYIIYITVLLKVVGRFCPCRLLASKSLLRYYNIGKRTI